MSLSPSTPAHTYMAATSVGVKDVSQDGMNEPSDESHSKRNVVFPTFALAQALASPLRTVPDAIQGSLKR